MNIKSTWLIAFSVIAVALSGCGPYNAPEYVEVKPSQTAFVVPLEGNGSAQAKLMSEEFLNQNKVSARRIQIPKRENPTGRVWWDYEWIPTVRVLVVDRAPVTVKWDSPKANVGNGIWVESGDSIGFSTGFSVSAEVHEEDAAKFLYHYASMSLEGALDSTVRARVQRDVASIAAKYKIDDLRERKNEILDAIEKDVIPYFAKSGITITSIGQFGGFTYENDGIQHAIDGTFIAQQEKVVNAAKLAAQGDANRVVEMAALAAAEAAKTKAGGEAEGKKLIASAEAEGIRSVNKALAEANQNPQLLELRRIEVERVRADRWNGAYPQWMWNGSGDGKQVLLNVPAPKP